MRIETGDIANCYTRKKIISRLIGKLTKSEFSHTAIFIRIGNKLMVADAQKDGFQIRSFNTWQKDYGYKYLLLRSKDLDKNDIIDNIYKYIGTTPYDFYSLLVRQPIKLIKLWVNNTFKSNLKVWNNKGEKESKKMYCSEVVAKVINAPNYYEMTPQDLVDYQLRNGFKKVN